FVFVCCVVFVLGVVGVGGGGVGLGGFGVVVGGCGVVVVGCWVGLVFVVVFLWWLFVLFGCRLWGWLLGWGWW
ncbi:hypothetical protein, partial [Klebsiella pneumoniae]|uniref:hypothetical protein n=1 Tax=Klebsiella pneumoniae TaxID=573 RepID=UPI001C3DB9E9